MTSNETSPQASTPVFRIRDHRGSYFKGMTPIGPMFGGTFREAKTFDDGWSAYHTITSFPMTVIAEIVNQDKKKCDVTGKPMGR